VARFDAEEAPEAAERAGPSLGTTPVALDSQADWGGPSRLFYKAEASRKHILRMPIELR
jgi:hypothetical protein